jgi:hypothetical protein
MEFSINGPRMVVLCSVLGVVDSNGQIASRCVQCPTDEQTDEHRNLRAILNSRNDAAGRSITKDPRTPVIKRAREILDSAIRAASIHEPSDDVRNLMMAIIENVTFHCTNKIDWRRPCSTPKPLNPREGTITPASVIARSRGDRQEDAGHTKVHKASACVEADTFESDTCDSPEGLTTLTRHADTPASVNTKS